MYKYTHRNPFVSFLNRVSPLALIGFDCASYGDEYEDNSHLGDSKASFGDCGSYKISQVECEFWSSPEIELGESTVWVSFTEAVVRSGSDLTAGYALSKGTITVNKVNLCKYMLDN